MAGSTRWAAKLAVGGAVVALPVALAAPAAAAYQEEDVEDVTITFVRNGQNVSCLLRGRLDYGYSEDTGRSGISALTIVHDDPGCLDAVYQASLSGTYETAPDSGEHVRFSAQGAAATGSAPGDFGALASFSVPGPTGHIDVAHEVRFRCDNPPAGSAYSRAALEHEREVT